MTKKPHKNPSYYRPNFWAFLRDVMMTAMNKGQLLPVGLFFIILIWVAKIPPQTAGSLAEEFLNKIVKGPLLGYVLASLFGAGWLIHSKYQRKVFAKEMNRIGNEKSELQKQLVAAESSENKKKKKK